MGLCSVSYRVRAAFVRSVHGYPLTVFSLCETRLLKSNETHGAKSNGILCFLFWGEKRENQKRQTDRRQSRIHALFLVGRRTGNRISRARLSLTLSV